MQNESSVVVITGASSGIGRATALELADEGASLVLAARDRGALEDVVRECEERGGRAIAVPTDVVREQEVQELARRAVAAFGRIDVWINGAAVALFGRVDEVPTEAWRRVIETNLLGTLHGVRAALAHFRTNGRGTLINIDSVVGGAPQPFTSAYVASKYAVRALSSCIRMELSLDKGHDIHVCTVMPAAIDTPLFQHAANYTGRGIKALSPTYRADKVAKAIVKLLDAPQAEVVVGPAGKAILAQAAMSLRGYEKTMARYYDRNHFQDRPARNTEGNLYRTAGPKDVSGGWTARPVSLEPKGRWSLAVAGAALGVFAVSFAMRRRKAAARKEGAGYPMDPIG